MTAITGGTATIGGTTGTVTAMTGATATAGMIGKPAATIGGTGIITIITMMTDW